MKELRHFLLLRIESDSEGTIGVLIDDELQQVCFMNELPWKNNESNMSCIPPGTYEVTYLERSASGKYRDVYHVQAVNGRSGILIHKGNFAGDSELGLRTHSHGCLLPASRVGELSGQRAGLASRGAMHKIHKATNREDFKLEVIHDA